MFSFIEFSYLLSAGVLLGGVYISRNYNFKDLLFTTLHLVFTFNIMG